MESEALRLAMERTAAKAAAQKAARDAKKAKQAGKAPSAPKETHEEAVARKRAEKEHAEAEKERMRLKKEDEKERLQYLARIGRKHERQGVLEHNQMRDLMEEDRKYAKWRD